jgi:hypothetical protein
LLREHGRGISKTPTALDDTRQKVKNKHPCLKRERTHDLSVQAIKTYNSDLAAPGIIIIIIIVVVVVGAVVASSHTLVTVSFEM